jgi:type I restriction enzyme, S subunit
MNRAEFSEGEGMSEWKEYQLNEVYNFASGLSKSREEFGFGFPFLSFKEVFHNYFLPKNLESLVNTTEIERQRCSVKRGDVFLTRTSETQEELGMSSVALIDYPDTAFNGFTKRLRPNGLVEAHPEYVGYYFRSPIFRATITSMASMTTRASLNNEMMAALKIVLPPLPEQKAIASILSSLDDKIDLLHRQNKTLEAIAETLFRQWFIEKAQDDWEESVLAKVVTITRGASPRPIMDYVQKGTVPWIKIADATGSSSFYIDSTKEFIIESGVSKSVEVYPGDLILSNSATCGLPYFVEIYGCIHDGWLLFRNFDLVSKYFVFFFLKQINRELNQVADGSVQNNLNTAILKEYPFRIPDKQALNQFDACVEPIIEKMKGNNRKIQTLEKLRDTLLPKLMSGEVRVEI